MDIKPDNRSSIDMQHCAWKDKETFEGMMCCSIFMEYKTKQN